MKLLKVCIILLLLATNVIFAQNKYERAHGVTQYDYSLKAELELEYTSDVNFVEVNTKILNAYKLKSPFFLQYNLNDLKFFRAEPDKFIGYEDHFIDSNYGFSDSRNENEILAGMMQADVLQKSEGDAVTTEQKLSGAMGCSIDVNFCLLGLKDQLKTGLKPKLTLFFSAPSCRNCDQQNVNGYAKTLLPDGNNFTVTDGLTLEVPMEYGLSYANDFINILMDRNMLESEKREKDKIEEEFKVNYYKNLPKIDAFSLVDFLISPKGVYEVLFEGSVKTEGLIPENTHFKGKLKIYGDKLYKFWVGVTYP